MKLVIMTKSTFFVEEDKILTMLFEAGLESLHISKTSPNSLYMERLLTLIPSEYHRKISIHNQFSLKDGYTLRGIHLDNNGITTPSRYRGVVSATCDDIMNLRRMKKEVDYVFLKNYRLPNEKSEDNEHVLSDLEIAEARRQGLIDKRVFAMGGVTLQDIPLIKDLGFGGVVIRNDLWNHFSIHSDLNLYPVIDYFQKLKETCK